MLAHCPGKFGAAFRIRCLTIAEEVTAIRFARCPVITRFFVAGAGFDLAFMTYVACWACAVISRFLRLKIKMGVFLPEGCGSWRARGSMFTVKRGDLGAYLILSGNYSPILIVILYRFGAPSLRDHDATVVEMDTALIRIKKLTIYRGSNEEQDDAADSERLEHGHCGCWVANILPAVTVESSNLITVTGWFTHR